MAIREVPDSASGAIRREVDSGRGHSVRRRIAKVMVGYPNNPDIRIYSDFGWPASSAGVERMLSKAGKLYNDEKKGQQDESLEHALFAAANTE